MYRKIIKLSAFSLLCASVVPAFSARTVDLSLQPINFLHTFSPTPALAAGKNLGAVDIKEMNQATDFNQTVHVRIKQVYAGYPVWGGDGVIHIPHATNTGNKLPALMAAAEKTDSSMNGTMYQDLQKDLQNTPPVVFDAAQADKAFQQALAQYENKVRKKVVVEDQKNQLMVYVDNQNQAHWVFHVSFYVKSDVAKPALPNYLIDAVNFNVYKEWNDVKSLENAAGGGFGGNKKIGKLVYDGLNGDLPKLDIKRDANKKICYLQNDDVTVSDYRTKAIAQFTCEKTDGSHGDIYWDGNRDQINGGYSPEHDALYAGKVIKAMYRDWYQLPVLVEDGKPMVLDMITHSPNIDDSGQSQPDNAYWDEEKKKMYFGDGDQLYPLTSLGVAAHEISHGFTEQHSNLVYEGQSGGLNESFSDMAAQAAEFYSQGHNNWQIGPEIFKQNNMALRYMDQPSKDCYGNSPGRECSIDNAKQYYEQLDVHFSSGVFNRAFYKIAKANGWDVKMAFNVMVTANQNYWTPTIDFSHAACGVLAAAKDYNKKDKKYDLKAVTQAFDDVKIDISRC